MSLTSSRTIESSKIESSYDFTWIIRDFFCLQNGASFLPSLEIEFDLCTDMHFTAYLSIAGDTCRYRIFCLNLKCTTHSNWTVQCEVKSKLLSFRPLLTYNKGTAKCSLSKSSFNCLIDENPINLTFSFAHVKYQQTPDHCFSMKKSKFNDDFLQLFQTKKFWDVTFQVTDKEIHAHKNILACRSPVFEAMFEHQMKETLSNRVVIEDMEPAVFEEMLRFIYCDEVIHLKKFAVKLLPASDKYNLERLKSICEKELADNIAIENAAETFVVADLNRAQELKKKAVNFIKTNKTSVARTQGWKEMLKNHSHLVVELFLDISE